MTLQCHLALRPIPLSSDGKCQTQSQGFQGGSLWRGKNTGSEHPCVHVVGLRTSRGRIIRIHKRERRLRLGGEEPQSGSLEISVALRSRLAFPGTLIPDSVIGYNEHRVYTENIRYCFAYYFKSKSKSLSLSLLCLFHLGHRVKISESKSRNFCSTLIKQSDLSELCTTCPVSALHGYGTSN